MQTEATRVPDERPSGAMGFATFVKELDKRMIGPDGVNVTRIRCPPESRLSQEFECRMQALLVNYDLDDRPPSVAVCDDPYEADGAPVDCASGTFDAALNGDSNDGELADIDQDEADESGDRSSDDQQHSRSLSLSYSLSISHTMEHSQSTDKGLSKRYDSPCSYEDDRESECTNFDKLDDWNDFINDMQNNNGAANLKEDYDFKGEYDFKEYYDGYLASKMQTSGEDVDDGAPSATEKCRSYLEYRSSPAPENVWDEELLDDNSNLPSDGMLAVGHGPQTVAKRKRALDDAGDCEGLASELAKFKLLKTDHDNRESPSKTPIPPALPLDDGSLSSATTTPTNCAKKLPPGEAGRALLMDEDEDFIPFGAIETLHLEP